MFNLAIKWNLLNRNPTHKIKKFKEKQRERFLEGHEIPKFFKALAEEPNELACDYFLICLLTGARKSKVSEMRQDEINFDKAEWYVQNTKSGDSIKIPLMPEAIQILKRRIANNSQNPWIFPGTGRTGHYIEPKRAWQKLLKKAGIKNLRIHDLRRSLGSWQAATGASLPIIGKTLGHKNPSTTAIYARVDLDPVRKSMQKATQAIFSLVDR